MATTPVTVRPWVSDAELYASLDADFDRVWKERVETPEWLEGYAKACPVDGTEPRDYRLREIDVGADASVLAGIHFLGRDVTRPFVNVFAQTRELSDAGVANATSALIDTFAAFKPPCVRWWSPEQRELRGLPGATGDHRLVIGRIPEISSGPPLALPGDLSFAPEDAARGCDTYRQAYSDLIQSNTLLGDRLRAEEPGTLEGCARSGALWCLRDAGRFAGLMAARPQNLRGIRGWEIVEELLSRDYRGRRIAAAMQRRFISGLDTAAGELVFGEIHDVNLPSLKTAARVGRRDVGGWVFIVPEGVDFRP